MLKICVLEDEAAQMERMKAYLQKFQSEHADFEYILDAYKNAFDLLEHYKRDVDLLFLDIRVPDMSGMEVAHRIREADQNVMIIFVTNPTVKQQAEDVLKQLGIPMATAIDMYLRQITLTGGIPFSLSLPKAPAALNADAMTDDQLHAALQVGIKEIQNGDIVDAASAFAQFREQHR